MFGSKIEVKVQIFLFVVLSERGSNSSPDFKTTAE